MRAQAVTQVRPKGAVLAAWMANVEAEPEWEYHLQTELERGIVRTEWLASGEALYTYHVPAVQGRAFVQYRVLAGLSRSVWMAAHHSFRYQR